MCEKEVSRRGREDISDVFILVLDLRWFEHSRNAHGSVSFFFGFLQRLRFLLLEEKLRVIPRELLKCNEEITKRELECVNVAMKFAKAENETLNLCTE